MLRWTVQTLCKMRSAAMEREGRTEELHAMPRLAFGEDDGPAVARSIRRSLESDDEPG